MTTGSGPVHAVIAFTGHHVIAADIEAETVRHRLSPDDLSAPMSASFLLFLASWLGAQPGTLDVFLACPAGAAPDPIELWVRDDLDDHRRVARARRYRPESTVYATCERGEPEGVLVVGNGVAGRWEMAFEVEPSAQGQGLGRKLAATASTLVPDGEPVFAQVAPGNAASLRAVVAAGYIPLGGEVLFVTR